MRKLSLGFAAVIAGVAALASAGDVALEVGELKKSDYDAGIVLVKVGQNERFDFSPCSNAVVCTDWARFGAARDWFNTTFGEYADTDNPRRKHWDFQFANRRVEAFSVFSHGTIRPSITNAATCISPFNANLGIVPKANHHRLAAANAPSQFWHCFTPSNTLQLTWQNVLLDRDILRPVSFQAEIESEGDMIFRYDLSRLPESVVTNVSIGVLNDGKGKVFSQLPRETTSLRWAYLNPRDGMAEDHDHDGISTYDELFTYHTNPYSADTDGDGLSDYVEIKESGSDPRNAYSLDGRFYDGIAQALGNIDAFSSPKGDGYTALENVFYSGSATGKSRPPESSDTEAVLKVTADDTVGATLKIGGQRVPLVPGMPTLKVALPRGEKLEIEYDGNSMANPTFDSDDFCFGDKDSWLVFPLTAASHACLHTLDSNTKEVTLNPGDDFDDLTCTWNASENVGVENLPPLSAKLTAHFKRNSSAGVTYTLAHPDYLFGKTTYKQMCRYCPQIKDEEEDGYSSTEDYYEEIDDGEGTDDDSEEYCFEHDCLYEQCKRLAHETGSNYWDHVVFENVDSSNEFDAAISSDSQYSQVLMLRRPSELNEKYCFRNLAIDVPDEKFHCCDCEEHWASYASLGYKSHRLAVHLGDEPFVRTTEDCTLNVFGTLPSKEYEGDSVSIVVNNGGAMSVKYTVFGVSILAKDKNLRRLNELSADFGLPVLLTVGDEESVKELSDRQDIVSWEPHFADIEKGETLQLATDVLLPDGNVRLAFEDASAHLQLWLRVDQDNYRLILDSDTQPELDMPIVQWRKLIKFATSDRLTDVKLVVLPSSTGDIHGNARLRFGYAGGKNDTYLHDDVSQMITVVPPPLLPDYNRDGKIDKKDERLYAEGKQLYFWANEDVWRGDDGFAAYKEGINLVCPDLEKNNNDDKVNGRNDLVNLCPFAIELSREFNQWGDSVVYEFITSAPGDVKFVPVRTKWENAGKIINVDQKTLAGDNLHESKLLYNKMSNDGEEPYKVKEMLLRLGDEGAGMLAVEFDKAPEKEGAIDLSPSIRIRDSASNEIIFERRVNVRVLNVHEMYRWINLYSECDTSIEDKYNNRTQVTWPDDAHADANVFFVHGFNMNPCETWEWSQVMFKRLWWCGMDASFTAVTWRGNQGQFWSPIGDTYVTRNYHQNVLNAFRSAAGLAKIADSLPGARKYFVAHSLGNMLVSAARQDYGLKYEKYFMLNAAVPIEAYDPEGVTEYSRYCMTPEEWRYYPDRVRASHWHELFSESDARRKLSWNGRFKDVDNTVNFYSSKDEVVGNGDGKWKEVGREYAWYNQELAKGGHLVDLCPEAGWKFSSDYLKRYTKIGRNDVKEIQYRRYTPDETSEIQDSDIMISSFFNSFSHHNLYGTEGGNYLNENPYAGWRALSHGIPAESFATGANPVPKWGNNNVDVQGFVKGRKWVHSYFIGQPMSNVGELYNRIARNVGRVRRDNE